MSRIASVFSRPGHTALIPYVTVGYPNIEATLKVVPLLASSGCDIVELGIPFSDPLADGVTIQKASLRALQNGVTPNLCLEVAKQLSHEVDIPLVLMSYFNLVFRYGVEEFCSACASSGVSGLIIPDLPSEEGAELEEITKKLKLDLIYLLAPTSTEERISMIAKRSRGFIYLVSLTGVTGARQTLPAELEDFVNRVRQRTNQPLCVGFGVSTREQTRRVAKVADGVIVGSRLIQLIEEDATFSSLKAFILSLREALS